MPRKDYLGTGKQTQACGRPFPRLCPECGKVEVQPATVAYDAEVKHDGRLHTFHIPHLQISKCGACGGVLFSNITDNQISQALREYLVLLSPEQIRDALNTLGLKQKDLAERIGVAAETISRWMSGTHIQSRAMDNLMRLFFAFDTVRAALPSTHPDKNLGVNIAEHTASERTCGAGESGGKSSGTSRVGPFTRTNYPVLIVHPTFLRDFSQVVLSRQRSFQLIPNRN